MSDQYVHQVFISYATPDRERVLPYYTWLKEKGLEVWIDCQSIRPGQNWDFEIKRALNKSSFVVAFISRHSYNRPGYIQRELKIALDNLLEKLIDDIYIVPVILDDDADIPEQLKGIQCISDSDSQCKMKISDALTFQLGRLGVQIEQTQRQRDFYWRSTVLQESWEGLPGYEFEARLLSFSSEKYPNIHQVGEYLRGHVLGNLFRHRADKLAQSPEIYNYGQDKFRRTNTYDAHCGDPSVKGRVITVQYAVHWYGAGAAHPNFHFETFSFVIEPLTLISSLEDIFVDPSEALKVMQEEIRRQLLLPALDENSDEMGGLDQEWVIRGTASWSDLSAFVFAGNKVDLLFAPYQVASYAEGAKFAEVPYEAIVHLIRPEFRSALALSI